MLYKVEIEESKIVLGTYFGKLYIKRNDEWIEIHTTSKNKPSDIKQTLVEFAINYSYDVTFQNQGLYSDSFEFEV